MGKKRRPAAKSPSIIHGTAPSAASSSAPCNLPNTAANGISLPPAIAQQILAAMSRGAASNDVAMPMDPAISKQYLDEMGRMIAQHVTAAGPDGKAVYGPERPPVEFHPHWSKKMAADGNDGGMTSSVSIDASSLHHIQQMIQSVQQQQQQQQPTNSNNASFSFAKTNKNASKRYNPNNPEDVKTMLTLFSDLMGMNNNSNAMNTTTTGRGGIDHSILGDDRMENGGNEDLAREFYDKFIASDSSTQQQHAMLHTTDPLALRKAAFAAGVNVAMQQQMMREEIHEKERGKGKSKNVNVGGTNPHSANLPVFSMIFGQNNNSGATDKNHPRGSVPPIPPPPNGWPVEAPAAAAAAAAAAFANSLQLAKDASAAAGNNQSSSSTGGSSQYCNPAEFAGAFSSPELGSPAWLEYYFEEYARNQARATGSISRDRPDPPSKADCPAHFEYGDDSYDDEDDEEERLMEEQRIILEAEEAERKAKAAAKKKEKRTRKKERAKKEAEAKAATAAKKKRDKAITSWRSRVVAACTSADVAKMETLLSESPYKNYTYDPAEYDYECDMDNADDDGDDEYDIPRTQEEYVIRQLNWFLPNVLQKYPESVELGKIPFQKNEAREKLAKYIMNQSFDTMCCIPGPNMLRNALHTAALHNDVNLVKWIIEGQKEVLDRKESSYVDCLDALCDDVGWSPLHYAVAAGSEAVVELLLEAACNIRGRSDYELTCMKSSSHGITARELATVLQSGAIHEDLSCDGDVLDEIIEDRIVCANTNEKNAYMRILRSLTERLEDVEINGFSPLQKVDESSNTTSKNMDNTTSTVGNSKKSKKKKKKQQQQSSPTAVPSLSNNVENEKGLKSNPTSSPEEDLSDPVAVALLGMGFTAEQITNAAKALGGFDRATADDMVMWILSGGEAVSDEQENNNSTDANTELGFDDSNHTDTVVTKAEKKAAAKAKRDAEELARKRQEEIAAAERAAAKREEQRRIRREWNEREQARQEVEKNAKIAEAVAKKRQTELQKLQTEMAAKTPTLPPVPQTINVGSGKGKSKAAHGPPQNIVASTAMVGKKSLASVSNMGIPKGPNVKAPKILARPNDAPPGALHNSIPQAGPSSHQPLFPSGHTSANAVPANVNVGMPKSRKHPHALPPRSNTTTNKYYNPNSGASSTFGYDQAYSNDAGSMPLASDGNNYYSAEQSANNFIPPPGFKSSVLPPPTIDPSLNAATNPLGEIRATAREFVPTSFAPVHEGTPSGIEFNTVPSMSSQPATVSHSHVDTQSSSNEVSSLLDPMSTLLNTAIPAPVTKSDSPVQSATSSITGFSGTVEEGNTSRVGSALTFESAVGGIQTSSILESISYSGQQDSGMAGLSSAGIWGGSNNNTNNNHSNLGGLVGLNFSSFLNGGEQKNNLGQTDDHRQGKNQSNTDNWGTGTSGSIW